MTTRPDDARGDLYGVLGVRADASATEIRAAYLGLARQLHPDRLLDRPAEERRRAERRLQDVNRAWSVLRDEARRREYDRRGAPPAPGTGAAGPAGPPPRPGAGRPLSDEDDLVEVAPGGGCFGGVVLGGFVALLLGIAIVTAFARRDPDGGGPPAPAPTVAPVERAEPGDCVRYGSDGLAVVPCDGAHDALVVEIVTFPVPCPSALVPADLAPTDIRLCLDPNGG